MTIIDIFAQPIIAIYGKSESVDQSGEVQAAINSLRGVGGTVLLRGKFLFTSGITLYPGIALKGGGPLSAFIGTGTDSIKVLAGFTGPVITIVVDPLFPSNSVFPLLYGFTINGGGAGQTSQDGILISGVNGVINDVYIEEVGIFFVGGNGVNVIAGANGKYWMHNCYFEDCGQNGVLLNTTSITRLSDCYVFGNTLNGLDIESSGICTIIGCVFNGNVQNGVRDHAQAIVIGCQFSQDSLYAIDATSCLTLVAIGNQFQNTGNSAAADSGGAILVWSNTDGCSIVGNNFLNNGGTGNANIRWRFPVGAASGVSIIGNVFVDTRGASATKYFINVDGGVVIGTVQGNTFNGQLSANPAFINTGTGRPAISGNIGFNPGTAAGVMGLDNRSGVTAADGSPIVLFAVPAGANQLFDAAIEIDATAFTSGTATYTMTYTENAVSQTIVVTATVLNVVSGVRRLIQPDASTNVTVQLTGPFVATCRLSAALMQLA